MPDVTSVGRALCPPRVQPWSVGNFLSTTVSPLSVCSMSTATVTRMGTQAASGVLITG